MNKTTLEEMLQAPFTDEVKQRQGRAGMTFDYIDARTAMQRLDDTLGLSGWEFHIKTVIGGDKVVGSLTVHTPDGSRTHEDVGYPNGDQDEEPLKSAVSDALKRCAVHVGVGRHLYFDSAPQRAHAAERATPSPRQAGSPPPRPAGGDGTWVCPEHGDERIGSGRSGLYCQVRGGQNTNAKGYCNYNESNTKPVEARPRPQTNEGMNQLPGPEEPPEMQESFDTLPF